MGRRTVSPMRTMPWVTPSPMSGTPAPGSYGGLIMEGLRVSRTIVIPLGELELRFSRSGGPGGQNVNTRSTRVEAVFDVAGWPSLGPRQRPRVRDKLGGRRGTGRKLTVRAAEERRPAQNPDAALGR